MIRRRCRAFLAVLGLSILGAGCQSPGRVPRHVVIVSIDGFASDYLDDPRADLPNLRRLAREGAFARRMEVSFPSVTWTCHTTLITGATPARHGIIANTIFDRRQGLDVAFIGDAVYTKDEALRVPTLYDAVHACGLKSASVIWPATAGAPTLDWAIPDSSKKEILERHTTPGLALELEEAGLSLEPLGRWGWDHAYSAPRDDLYTRIATYLLKKHRPHLLLLHLITPDGVEHDHGPQTPEAYWAVRYADQRLGEIRQALESAALSGLSTLMVVADHGFLPFERTIKLNALFLREGLIELDAQKQPARRRAWAVAAGGAAGVYLHDEDAGARQELAAKVTALLKGTEGVEAVLEPSQFIKLGLPDPAVHREQADLMATAREGYAFAKELSGEVVEPTGGRRGTHGHLPQHPRLGALFVAWGAGIRQGVALDEVRAIDVAPTAARLLGVPLPEAQGRVLEEILESAAVQAPPLDGSR